MSAALAVTMLGGILVMAGTVQVVDHIDIVFDPFIQTPREDVFACYAIAFGCVLIATGLVASYMELGR